MEIERAGHDEETSLIERANRCLFICRDEV
jgi:hypothetical protein